MARCPIWLVAIFLALPLWGQESQPASAVLQREVRVPLHAGQLQVDELARALCAAYEIDGRALRVPQAQVDLRGAPGYLLLVASRKLLLDTARFRRDLPQDQLLVTIDRERTREVRRMLRTRVAAFLVRLTGEDPTLRRYELLCPPVLDAARPLCVLVHGVESDAGIWDDLSAFLAAEPRRVQVATFAYPNDESIERVAAELANRLRALGPQAVVLVGHSMGGLVARAVVEDPVLDPRTVRTLVLLGVPNQGSNLAGFRFALEAADTLRGAHSAQPFARELVATMVDHWRDGLGEAGGDLLPGSVCLGKLAQRGRNPQVEYHAVLGTRSVLRDEQLADLRHAVAAALADRGLAKAVRPRLERWLADLDEIVDGKGDGAVSVARGRLDGVEPELVHLDHVGLVRLRGLLGRVEKPEDHLVFSRVATWLAAPARTTPR